MFGERLQSQAFVLDQDSGSESLCSVIVTWSTGNAAASDTGCKDSCCKDVRILATCLKLTRGFCDIKDLWTGYTIAHRCGCKSFKDLGSLMCHDMHEYFRKLL